MSEVRVRLGVTPQAFELLERLCEELRGRDLGIGQVEAELALEDLREALLRAELVER